MFCHEVDICMTLLYPRLLNYHGRWGRKIVWASVIGWFNKVSSSRHRQQDSCMHELTMIVITCSRCEQDQPRQQFKHGVEGDHWVPTLIEETLEIIDCSDRENLFYFYFFIFKDFVCFLFFLWLLFYVLWYFVCMCVYASHVFLPVYVCTRVSACLCVHSVSACLCVHKCFWCPQRPEEGSELHTIVSCCVGVGNWTQVFCRSRQCS